MPATARSLLPELWSRPSCVPGGTADLPTDCPNYVQGADPILRSNGNLDLLVNAGQLGDGSSPRPVGHWEGLFVLRFPADARLPVRWHPIWATNDWGTAPSRQEFEASFPSAIRWKGTWRIAYSSTSSALPYGSPNCDRVGRVDLTGDLTDRAPPDAVTPWWVAPVRNDCIRFGSNGGACPGRGSGVLPSFAVDSRGRLLLYHQDGSSGCDSGLVRHVLRDDLTPAEAACVTFRDGPRTATPEVTDVARGSDGLLLALSNGADLHEIQEWTADASGLVFRPTGRAFASPGPDRYPQTVWDGAYLKTEDRRIVKPGFVIANRALRHWDNAAAGDWHLVWWADEGARLPASFVGTLGVRGKADPAARRN